MPMETRHDLEHTTERLTKGLRCPWKWGLSPGRASWPPPCGAGRATRDRPVTQRPIGRRQEGRAQAPRTEGRGAVTEAR